MGLQIIEKQQYGAYLKVTETQKAALAEDFYVNELPGRTIINMGPPGISFDTETGYDLPEEWTNPETNTYMVQFVLPAQSGWMDEVAANAGDILGYIGDNVVITKMTDSQKARVSAMDTVQWVGNYEPAFKVDSDLKQQTGTVRAEVFGFPGVDENSLGQQLKSLGAWYASDYERTIDVMETSGTTGYGSVVCDIDTAALPQIASLEDVYIVSYVAEPKIFNQKGGQITQAHDLWDNRISNLPNNIRGEGQIVHVQDTGLDASHQDFTLGPLGNRILYAESNTDADGHGTHVSGTVLGNGYMMESYLGLDNTNRIYNELAASNPAGKHDLMGFAGRAPEATLYHRAGLGSTEWSDGYTAGARIFSNSWGRNIFDYDGTGDSFMINNDGAIVVFAAGNEGPAQSTGGDYSNGKLVVSVGARENMRADSFSDGSDDYQEMVEFSSRGPPSGEIRVKPDIVEPGSYIYSTKSDDVSETEYPGLYDVIDLIDTDNDGIADYAWMFGTSMACPGTAGNLALIRDYLVDVHSIANPHANLMKLLLIHGAEDMGYGYPSYDQGWGGTNVRNSIAPIAPNVLQWSHQGTGTAGTWNAATNGGMDLMVIDSSIPIKFTMTHWDTSTTSGTLAVDYDLVITSPDGTRYEGNAFSEAWSTQITAPADWTNAKFPSWMGGDDYDFDTANDGGDDINNVEMVRIENPLKGTWTAEIVSRSGGGNPFSFAVTGGMDSASDVNANAYKVGMALDNPRIVMERDGYGESQFRAGAGSTATVGYWLNNGGTTSDSYSMSSTLPGGFSVTFSTGSPTGTIAAGAREHAYANIAIGASVTPGSYTCKLKATSGSDGVTPIAQSEVSFQIDVLDTKLPAKSNVADAPVHEDQPAPVSWAEANDGGAQYIALAYRQSEQFGNRVYFKLSRDGGATWETGIPVGPRSYYPGWVTIEKAPGGGLMIAYNAYNPDPAVAGSTEGNQVRIAYLAYPYTSVARDLAAFDLGEGPGGGGFPQPVEANGYRTINIAYYPAASEWHLVVEDFGYSSQDLSTAGQTGIYCVEKISTDNGATWSAWVQLDPGVAGMYYFFPHVYRDYNGNLALWFYQRDSADNAQDRDATWKYYTGTWSAMTLTWDTGDNLMMPQGVAAQQGANNNRNYGMYLKGAHTDGDRQYYLHYTDDATNFDNNGAAGYGPLGGVVASDHSYGTGWIGDMSATTDSYVWATLFRHQNYDPYGQPNILTTYANPYPTGASRTDYVTNDCLVKNKVRVAEYGTHNYMFYDTWSKDGNVNIKMADLFVGWDIVADITGPLTTDATTDKQNVLYGATTSITVSANADEWETGGSNIAAAEYWTDVNPTPVAMQPTDGAFDSKNEGVYSGTTKINTATWGAGGHTVYVRSQDSAGNWGDADTCVIYVETPIADPNPPSNKAPADGTVFDPAVATVDLTVAVSHPNAEAMTVRFYGDAGSGYALLNTQTSVASGTTVIYTWTVGTGYHTWYATAQDADSGEVAGQVWDFDNGVISGPVITATTFPDGATGVSTAAGVYDIDFSKAMDTGFGTLSTNLPTATQYWWDSDTYRVEYGALTDGTTYNVDLSAGGFRDTGGLALEGDMYKYFTAGAGSGNSPPNAPSNPVPANGATGVGLNPTLSVNVTDPDGDPLNVTFYDASGPTQIGTTQTGIASGGTASVTWSGLAESTTYSWYATSSDGEFITTSATWSFTTLDTTAPASPTGLTVEKYSAATGGGGTALPTAMDANDGSGTLISEINADDGVYATVGKNIDFWIDAFDSSAVIDPISAATLVVEYTVPATGTPTNQIEYALDEATFFSTGIQPTGGDTDVVATFDLFAAGVDTAAELGALDIYYRNNDGGGADIVSIDYVWVTYSDSGGAAGTDHNQVNWTASLDDGAGANDVDYYQVYRTDTNAGPWDVTTAYAQVTATGAATYNYEDVNAGDADATIWWYVVRAVDLSTNMDSNTNAVPEPGNTTTAYDIPIPALGWVFVSFPIDISGDVQTILDDSVNGDGGTIWDMAKWYDGQTKTWESYRAGYASTLTTINNTMGVWLHVTANGGDQNLTTTQAGSTPASVDIQLYAGWNLVGCPLVNPTLASDTLPVPTADIIGIWQSTSPYVNDITDLTLVTMEQGNAYWVHVTADTTWNVVNP